MGWQRASGYNWRALVEADIGRYKRVIGDALRSRTKGRQTIEVAIAVASLNRMLQTSTGRSSPLTRRWRNPDSNLRSRITRPSPKPLYSPDLPTDGRVDQCSFRDATHMASRSFWI